MFPKLKGCLVLIVLAAVGCIAEDPYYGHFKPHSQGSHLQKALEVAKKYSDPALKQLESWGKVAVTVLKSLGHPELAGLGESGAEALSKIYNKYMKYKQSKGNKHGAGQRALQGEEMDKKENEFPDPMRFDEELEHEDKPKIDIAVFLSGFNVDRDPMKGVDLNVKLYRKDLVEIFRKKFTLPGRHLGPEVMRAADEVLETFWNEHNIEEIQHPKKFLPGLGESFFDPRMGEPSISGMGGHLFDLRSGGVTEPQLSGDLLLDAPLHLEQPPKPPNKEKGELLKKYDFDHEQNRTEESGNNTQQQKQPANDPKTDVYSGPKYPIPNNKQPRAPGQYPHHQPNTQSKYQYPKNAGKYPLHNTEQTLDHANSPDEEQNYQQIIGEQSRPYNDPDRDLSSNAEVPDASSEVDTTEKEIPKIVGDMTSRNRKRHGPHNEEPKANTWLQEQDDFSTSSGEGTRTQTVGSKHPKLNQKTGDSVLPRQQTGELDNKPRLTQTGGNSTESNNVGSPPLNYPNNKNPVQFYPRPPRRKPRRGVSKWKIPFKIGTKLQWSNGKWSLRRNNAGQYRPQIGHGIRPLRTG